MAIQTAYKCKISCNRNRSPFPRPNPNKFTRFGWKNSLNKFTYVPKKIKRIIDINRSHHVATKVMIVEVIF